VIEVENLTFAYRGTRGQAVRGVSFSVAAGEIFGFLGPSGAGKSTIQKILTGLLRPYEGHARVLGEEVRGRGPEYYEDIGVGFELPNHFMKLTALENLRFFASFYLAPGEPLALLARVGLEDAAHRRVEDFSKGMKMRLCFVRALMHQPRVLFLDEPTSGLDPVNARLLKDIVIEEKQRGTTIFLTTHNMHDAEQLCDRVAFLVDGGIRRSGAPKELVAEEARRTVAVTYRQGDELLTREFPLDGLDADREFLDVLRHREVVSLHSQEASLEDVFVEATGRRLV
jgi:fluoroquinolone transport system ATP-binding protein